MDKEELLSIFSIAILGVIASLLALLFLSAALPLTLSLLCTPGPIWYAIHFFELRGQRRRSLLER